MAALVNSQNEASSANAATPGQAMQHILDIDIATVKKLPKEEQVRFLEDNDYTVRTVQRYKDPSKKGVQYFCRSPYSGKTLRSIKQALEDFEQHQSETNEDESNETKSDTPSSSQSTPAGVRRSSRLQENLAASPSEASSSTPAATKRKPKGKPPRVPKNSASNTGASKSSGASESSGAIKSSEASSSSETSASSEESQPNEEDEDMRKRMATFELIKGEDIDIGFADIVGAQKAKEKLRKNLILRWQHPAIFDGILPPSKGLLLHGPPGCGKTMLAKAVAAELSQLASGPKWSFIAVKKDDLDNKFEGESGKYVQALFRKARENAPCVIFFDECDSILKSRSSQLNNNNDPDRVNSILQEWDGIHELKDVFILGATNNIEGVDSAAKRPGRFGAPIYVGEPDLESRKIFFCKKMELLKSKDVRFDPLVTPEFLAHQCDGFSGAEMDELLKLACGVLFHERLKTFKGSGMTGADFELLRCSHVSKAMEEYKSPTSSESSDE